MAARQRDRGNGTIHRVDLHAVGRCVGEHSGHYRTHCMVLADAQREQRNSRFGAEAVTQGVETAADGSLDVSKLRSYGFGHSSMMWWGTAGVMAIEGTVFALAVMTYFYLRTRVPQWPPGVASPL